MLTKPPRHLHSTRDFINLLSQQKQLLVIDELVDPNLELMEIHRQVVRQNGPALLFTKVKNTSFPVATNLYGSEQRLQLAFGEYSFRIIQELAEILLDPPQLNWKTFWKNRRLFWQLSKIGVKKQTSHHALLENTLDPVDLLSLPQIKCWPEDGGAFITLPLVYTESPITGQSNLGMYRIQMYNSSLAGMHIQLYRGGGFHYFEAEQKNQSLKTSIMIGGPPAMTLAAIAPLPENISELLFASLLMGEKLKIGNIDQHFFASESDFCLCGVIPPKKRKPEGPFGDHYGFYSLCHDYPYVEISSIHHRHQAIFPATVVGRPPQEDHYLANFLQELLSPFYSLIMPSVKEVWAYGEAGLHPLAGAVVKDRFHKEAFTTAMKILSEGQLSLTKFLMVTDYPCHPRNFIDFFCRVLERVDFREDLIIFSNISQDTLDYTGPQINEGSKAILLGVGKKKRTLKKEWSGNLRHPQFSKAILFCPGVMIIQGNTYQGEPQLAEQLINEPDLQDFVLAFLVDDAEAVAQSVTDFFWHIFIRFEPAADIYGKQSIERFHIGFQNTPIIFDCRLKPGYPPVLKSDPKIAQKVKNYWLKKYKFSTR